MDEHIVIEQLEDGTYSIYRVWTTGDWVHPPPVNLPKKTEPVERNGCLNLILDTLKKLTYSRGK